MQSIYPFLPMDRRQALAHGQILPEKCHGAALFADISGFTPLTKALTDELGRRAGAEELLYHINPIYEALINILHRFQGSVIGFAGDAITCWLEEREDGGTPARAVACALEMQAIMSQFAISYTPGGQAVTLGIKVAVAYGRARRFLVGNPELHRLEALAGNTLAEMAAAEKQAQTGEVVITPSLAESLKEQVVIAEWRANFAVVTALTQTVPPTPWPPLPPQAYDSTTARGWVMPPVYEQLVAGSQFLGDLRPVLPMFIRFEGIDFDKDDEAGQKLDTFIQRVQANIYEWGGQVVDLTIGDKGAYLYCTFGAPIAHEDDVRRALAAALALQQLPNELTFINPLQIGLTRGEVWTGRCGAKERHSYAVMGNVVNLAARLMMQAEAGQVLVTESVAMHPSFDFINLGQLNYKGFNRPLSTYLLTDMTVAQKVFQHEMVGRQAELAQLLHFAQPLLTESKEANQSLGRVAIIYGEAGIGKSHLTYALGQSLASTSLSGETTRGVRWMTGQCDPILREPFNPFVYFLKSYFGQLTTATAVENKTAFEHRFQDLLTALRDTPYHQPQYNELVRTKSFLGAMLDLYWPDSLYEQLDAKNRYENSMMGVSMLLQAESRRQPVVLELEDGHWLDDASHELLTLLSRQLKDVPCFILITSRYADDGTLPVYKIDQDVPLVTFKLGVLTATNLANLAQAILGYPITSSLQALLMQKSEANPFFAQQILYYLQENDLLQPKMVANQTHINLTTTEIELPTTLNTLLVARLDRLTQRTKEVVQTAAVLGREFELRLLSHMLKEDISTEIISAKEKQIWSLLNALQYIFKHILLREAAYEMQLRTRLQTLHLLAAQTSETLYADQLPAYYGTLAYHYEMAYQLGAREVQDKACHYLHLAAQQALTQYENWSAIDYFTRALTLTDEADADQRYPLWLGREKAYGLLGKRDAQAQDLTQLQEVINAQVDKDPLSQTWKQRQAVVTYRQANYAELISDYEAVISWAQKTVRLAEIVDDPLTLARARATWGRAFYQQGNYPSARELYMLGAEGMQLALAAAAGNAFDIKDILAINLNGLGAVAKDLQNYTEAKSYFEQALAIRQETGDKWGVSSCFNNLGAVADSVGDYTMARAYFEQALTIRQEVGDQRGVSDTLANLGIVAWNLADYAGSIAYFEQTLAIYQAIGDRRGLSIGLLNLGFAVWLLGNYAGAIAYLKQALTIKQEIGDRLGIGMAWYNLGLVYYAQGDEQQAQMYSQQAVALARELAVPFVLGYSLTHLGHTLLAQGKITVAQTAYQEAYELYQTTKQSSTVMEPLAGLARAALAQNDLETARQHIETILLYLAENVLNSSVLYPYLVHLSCVQVLQATGDERLSAVLARSQGLVRAKAAMLPEGEMREVFLAERVNQMLLNW